MLSYSKGSRGLFVPSRVIGIFTDTTISLSSRLRQRPDHYTIRAGRNLPDKEFRYLRTVIVTAAVYWGFNSELSLLLLTFQHRAGVRLYTASFDFAQPCVFVKQLPGPILCALPITGRDPFSRSYRVNLPSSLTVNHSSALVYSTRLRVSVCGTGTLKVMFSGFSWQYDYMHCWIVRKDAPYCQVRILWWICLPQSTSTPFNQLFRQLAALSRLRLHVTPKGSTGILTGSAIGLAVRLSLRTRLTLIRLALIRKPESCGEGVSHPLYRYLYLHLLFHTLQQDSRPTFDAEWNAPLPIII